MHYCEEYAEEDVALQVDEDGAHTCGKPATQFLEFEDGSGLWLCTEHFDSWMQDYRHDAEEFADEDTGREARYMLRKYRLI
jgi:hypothetical protein